MDVPAGLTARAFGTGAAVGAALWIASAAGPLLASLAAAALFAAAILVPGTLRRQALSPSWPQKPALARSLARLRAARSAAVAGRELAAILDELTGSEIEFWHREGAQWIDADGASLEVGRIPKEVAAHLARADPLVARSELARAGEGALAAWLDASGAALVLPFASGSELVGIALFPPELEIDAALRADLLEIRSAGEKALGFGQAVTRAEAHLAVSEEIDLAAELQKRLVPARGDLKASGLTLSALYWPASQCGGDWWAVHRLSKRRTLIAIGDVTGHGVPAAMVTAAAMGACEAAIHQRGNDLDPLGLLKILDAAVRQVGGGQFYMTASICILDPAAGDISFATAGHVPTYLFRDGHLDALIARGNPLGAGDAPSIGCGRAALRPRDVLIWYTDGLVECADPTGAMYGDRQFQRLLRRAIPSAADARELRDTLSQAALDFAAGEPMADDVTLIVGQL